MSFDGRDGEVMEKSPGFKFSVNEWHSHGDTVLVGISRIGSSSPRKQGIFMKHWEDHKMVDKCQIALL